MERKWWWSSRGRERRESWRVEVF